MLFIIKYNIIKPDEKAEGKIFEKRYNRKADEYEYRLTELGMKIKEKILSEG